MDGDLNWRKLRLTLNICKLEMFLIKEVSIYFPYCHQVVGFSCSNIADVKELGSCREKSQRIHERPKDY